MTEEQKILNSRIFDLVLGRVFKKAYLNFEENSRKDMEKVFLLDSDKEKKEFIKKYIPNFKKLFAEEAKNIGEEIKLEIEKQI